MKKKIVLLMLCMLMIVPLFVVGASASKYEPVYVSDQWQEAEGPDSDYSWRYGDICLRWPMGHWMSEDLTIYPGVDNAFSGAGYGNEHYVSFNGSKVIDEKSYPMALVISNIPYEMGNVPYSYVYLSSVFVFEWYVTQDGVCTVAVYSDTLMEDCILVYVVGGSFTLFTDNEPYELSNYPTIEIEFYFDMEYLNSVGNWYNPTGLGSFQKFMNCFSLFSEISIPKDNVDYYFSGYNAGYSDGAMSSQTEAYESGHYDGFVAGRSDAMETFDGVSFILGALFEAPYRFMSTFLDVQIFGINIFGIVSSIVGIALLVACVLLIVKFVGHFR